MGIQLILAAPAPAPANTFTWTNAATIIAAIGAALIAALVAVIGYSRQQRAGRRAERATRYAEALQAVEDYLEGPYRIRRRDGSPEARARITDAISATKSEINFYLAWLRIDAPAGVAAAYEHYVLTAQREAGPQMTAAWHTRPTRKDGDVPLGKPYPRRLSDAARTEVSDAMKRDLDR